MGDSVLGRSETDFMSDQRLAFTDHPSGSMHLETPSTTVRSSKQQVRFKVESPPLDEESKKEESSIHNNAEDLAEITSLESLGTNLTSIPTMLSDSKISNMNSMSIIV